MLQRRKTNPVSDCYTFKTLKMLAKTENPDRT